MVNILRKIRRRFFSNKMSSYLLYAVGEIVLVMIGILLALQVNNWNENRKQANRLNAVLQTIKTDFAADTIAATTIINFYKENQKNSKKIITSEITMDNYKECLPCLNLVTFYQPMNIQNKGYEQLKNFDSDLNISNDSLIADITRVYSIFSPIISKNNDMMENIVMKNFNAFEELPWYIDMVQGKITPEMIEYFVLSEDYKKRVASHSMLAVRNHLGYIEHYKLNVVDLINRIEKRLSPKDN